MRVPFFCSRSMLLVLGTVTLSAFASESGSPAPAPVAIAPVVAPSTAVRSSAPAAVDGFGQSVAAPALADLRGGTSVTENMTLTGTVSNNSADHVVTGYNSISAGSFNGAVGVPMVIQNTGNNVLIQNATIINVQFQP